MRRSGYGSGGGGTSTAGAVGAIPGVAGAGHADGGAGNRLRRPGRPRLPTITSTVPPASRTSPPAMRPIRAGSSQSTLIPSRASTSTPRLASAFINTTVQSPLSTSHVSCVSLFGRHLGDPEGLICRRLRSRVARYSAVDDAVRGELEVADHVVAHAVEIGRHVGGRADSGEDRRAGSPRVDRQPDGTERPPVDEPIGVARFALQVDPVRRDRVRGRSQADLAGLEVPIRALRARRRPVRPFHRRATRTRSAPAPRRRRS